ncbi:MAG TPA: hypothetical protein VFI15_08290 [Candidatus Limnocylindrales bacterium]|nr:hypothetical protein [Candidatus Limnocylindrales bacterium]
MNPRLATRTEHPAAIVWLDRQHALIARAHEGHPTVTEVDREADPSVQYLLRVAHEAADCDRVVIAGPDSARLDFERAFVALYHRPDRLIDVGVSFQPRRHDLIEQLEMIDPVRASH